MSALNAGITRVFDFLFAPFTGSPWLGMMAVSMLTGVVLLLVFRYTSNQRGIRRAKDLIVSHLLEVLLYRDELRVVLRAQARLLWDNLRYLGYALVPLACMILPVFIFLVQTDLRYGRRPLRVGERTILAVKLRPGAASTDQVSISAPPGIVVETASLRMPAIGEVDWRLRAAAPGEHEVRIGVGGEEVAKRIVVGKWGGRVPCRRVGEGAWQQFLNPGEPPLPAEGAVAWISVSYPAGVLRLFGWRFHWIWPWLIISMAFGYALKGPLRVQV